MAVLENASLTSQSVPGIDSTGTVTGTYPCRKCSYILCGLNETGRCPECGTPVGFSLKGDLLRFSQPEWLDTLRTGARLILYSILVMTVGEFCMAIIAIWLHLGGFMTTMPILIANVMSLLGSWKLTTPDPSGLGEDQYGTSRKLIRIGLAIALVNNVLSFIKSEWALAPVRAQLVEYFSTLIGLCGAVAIFAELQYLSKLALRLPDNQLSELARFLMYSLGITELMVSLLLGIQHRTANAQVMWGTGGTAIGVLLASAGTCLVVFAIVYWLMLARFGNRFKEAAASARLIWQPAV